MNWRTAYPLEQLYLIEELAVSVGTVRCPGGSTRRWSDTESRRNHIPGGCGEVDVIAEVSDDLVVCHKIRGAISQPNRRGPSQ